MTMSALSSQCGVSKQQSTRLINSLAETGLVERRPCKQDRRLIFICLSPFGKELLEKLRFTTCQAIEERLGVLSPPEQESMLLSLETIWKLVNKLQKKGDPA